MDSLLFSPLAIRGLTLRNRIMVSPMAQYCADGGKLMDWHLVHLGKFAQSGAGLVCVEATKVERRGMGTRGDTGLWHDGQTDSFRRSPNSSRPRARQRRYSSTMPGGRPARCGHGKAGARSTGRSRFQRAIGRR
jgi:hypothetical protein